MKKISLKLVGVLILIFVLREIDFSSILLRIRNCNLAFLSIAFFMQLAVLGIRVTRWKYILGMLKINVSFWDSLKAFWSGTYVAAITPGKVGDLSRVYFLGKNNPSLGRSILSVVLGRLADIISLFLLGLVTGLLYLKELGQLNTLLLIALVGLGLFIWIIFLKRNFFYKLFKKLLYKFISKERLPLKENLDLSILHGFTVWNYAIISIFVLLAWTTCFSGWWFLAKGLYIKIPFPQMVAAVSIASIIALIPITISGLGTRDATMIFIFSKLGIVKESALSFSLLIFTIEMAIICLGIFFFFQSLSQRGQQKRGK